MTSAEPREAPADGRDPWSQYGWGLAAVWLIFLIFPLISIFQAPWPGWQQAASVGVLVVFGAVYVRAFLQVGSAATWTEVERVGLRYLPVLGLLVLALSTKLGIHALSLMPYLISMGNFTLRRSLAIAWAVSAVAAAVLIPIAAGQAADALVYGSISLSVALFTGTIRLLDTLAERRRRSEEELALMAERDRVARDVHDVLGHSLTVVTVKAELAEKLIATDPERARAELIEIQSLSRQALAEIRATVAGLRATHLADELGSARSALAGAGITAELPTDVTSVDPRYRTVLAWALREAVTNVVRHSRATHCHVTMGSDWLRISDNGVGFCADHTNDDQTFGNGLAGLRERVEAAGGALQLRPIGESSELKAASGRPGTELLVQL